MKQIRFYGHWMLILAGCMGLLNIGCEEDLPLDHPALKVTASTEVCTVGEEVVFYLAGEADYLLFYPGGQGGDYRYSREDRIYPATVRLSFESRLEGGNQLTDILHLKYSTDFSGEYTPEAVRAATWTDITERFTVPAVIQTETTPSGIEEVTSLFESGLPVWFAWQYTMEAYDAVRDNERTAVYIYDFDLSAASEISEQALLQQATANWQFVYYGEGYAEDRFGPNNNATRLCLKCSPQPPAAREAWAISPAVTAVSEINLGVDHAITVKSYVQPFPGSYGYTFSEPGEYEVVFVALNTAAQGQRETVQRLRLTVVEAPDLEAGGETDGVEEEVW